jgi:hypothetical protein
MAQNVTTGVDVGLHCFNIRQLHLHILCLCQKAAAVAAAKVRTSLQ